MGRPQALGRVVARVAERTRPDPATTWSDAVDWISSWAFVLIVAGTVTLTAAPILRDLRSEPAVTAGVLVGLVLAWVLAVIVFVLSLLQMRVSDDAVEA